MNNEKLSKYTINKEDTVLMVIDIQERLVPVINEVDRVIDNTNILLEASEILDIPVIVTEQYPKGLGKTSDRIKLHTNNVYGYPKISFTAYTYEVENQLKNLNKNKVVIVGMETHVCVYQTIRDLLKNNYEVFLVSDAVSSRTEENYNNAVEMIKDMGCVVSNTETILFDLLKIAGTDEFKKISKLIK